MIGSASSVSARPAEGARIETTSRLKAWWLTRNGPYRVVRVLRRPQSGWFGRITYANTWVLKRIRG